HGGRGWRWRKRDFTARGGGGLARRGSEGDWGRAARTCGHGFAGPRALLQQGGPGLSERDQRREKAIAPDPRCDVADRATSHHVARGRLTTQSSKISPPKRAKSCFSQGKRR